jgi:hypothetical protein
LGEVAQSAIMPGRIGQFAIVSMFHRGRLDGQEQYRKQTADPFPHNFIINTAREIINIKKNAFSLARAGRDASEEQDKETEDPKPPRT